MKQNIFFITGIDTDAGKSYATGFLAHEWLKNGVNVITQKLIQTGNVGHSEDIDLHRKLMDIDHTEEDREGLTMPQIFSYPASPHLASRIDKKEIDFQKIDNATAQLSNRFDIVLLEGAGGIMVPLTEDYLTIDFIKERDYPIILVTSGKLGSINHTLLTLEAIRHAGLHLYALAYNLHPTVEDKTIQNDTMNYIKKHIEKYFPTATFLLIPDMESRS